jgi:4-hydroxybenzoate polyprenyltransferase
MVNNFNEVEKYPVTSTNELEKSYLEKSDITLAIGIISLFLGLMITIGSYFTVSQHGGSYYITYGAIAFGIAYIIKGLVNRKKNKKYFKNQK